MLDAVATPAATDLAFRPVLHRHVLAIPYMGGWPGGSMDGRLVRLR